MTYQEKGAWVYILAVAVSAGIYANIVIGLLAHDSVDDVDFGPSLLWSLGISIGLSIVLRIVIEILTPSDSYKIDARDREISRLAARVNGTMIAIGMAAPLLLAVFDADNFWIANAIYAVFVISAIVSSIVQVVAYRRGF